MVPKLPHARLNLLRAWLCDPIKTKAMACLCSDCIWCIWCITQGLHCVQTLYHSLFQQAPKQPSVLIKHVCLQLLTSTAGLAIVQERTKERCTCTSAAFMYVPWRICPMDRPVRAAWRAMSYLRGVAGLRSMWSCSTHVWCLCSQHRFVPPATIHANALLHPVHPPIASHRCAHTYTRASPQNYHAALAAASAALFGRAPSWSAIHTHGRAAACATLVQDAVAPRGGDGSIGLQGCELAWDGCQWIEATNLCERVLCVCALVRAHVHVRA